MTCLKPAQIVNLQKREDRKMSRRSADPCPPLQSKQQSIASEGSRAHSFTLQRVPERRL